MSMEIKIGPPHLIIHQGRAMLLTEPDGQIRSPSSKGLFFRDTRVMSHWTIYSDGEPWTLLNSGTPTSVDANILLVNGEFTTEQGIVPAHVIGLSIERCINGGIHEDLDLTNHRAQAVHFNLEIMLLSDFADIFEVKSGRAVRRGRIVTEWSFEHQQLSMRYSHRDFHRALIVTAAHTGSDAVYANGQISFPVHLAPHESWHCCMNYELVDGDKHFPAPARCCGRQASQRSERGFATANDRILTVQSGSEAFDQLFRQAVDDIKALELSVDIGGRARMVSAAGLPWFVALFGRDNLVAALQRMVVNPAFSTDVLDALGALQATELDNYRDAEPGKILHELRLGELAHFKLVPHTPYYGTADATPLYLIALHSAWRWIGDDVLSSERLEVAERCLEWIDQYGDRDGDGFQEYGTRSSAGYENQSWKDSGQALIYPDGSLVSNPKALCELQGYVYDAWLRTAEIYDHVKNVARAASLRCKAARLFTQFNESFWDQESGFYAFALDGEKRKVLSVASNPGHCLWSGIVAPERAEAVISRLRKPDMWSGWGIRTLSANHFAYNPHSYQNGAVWPHDNALIAQGFRRYGFSDEANDVARDVVAAGNYFARHRMPEVYAGLDRTQAPFPAQYLGANVPQAWAGGSIFVFFQTMLGLRANAQDNLLYIDPVIPSWVDHLGIQNVRVGNQTFDLQLWHSGGQSRFEVLKGDTDRVISKPITWKDFL
jgi:glycogen debranching enzyme